MVQEALSDQACALLLLRKSEQTNDCSTRLTDRAKDAREEEIIAGFLQLR
jgi:hypothetical protein